MKILFVHDGANVLRDLRRLFMDEDRYEQLIADCGAEGLQIFEQEQGAMVVPDFRIADRFWQRFAAISLYR